MQEKPLQSCVLCVFVCVCVPVLYQGLLNMGALHNEFKCLPGKMD